MKIINQNVEKLDDYKEYRKRLTPEMLEVIDKFDEIRKRNNL